MNTKLWKRVHMCCLVSALGLAALILVAETGRAALPEGRSVDIETQGTSVSLYWLSITNAPYVVESRTNLVQGSWGVLDTIVNAGGVTVYPVTPDDSPSRFFRVLFPQPVVTAGEPARTTTGTGGSYLYITGEFFYAGDQVRVGGLLASNIVFVTPSLLRVELPPGLLPGRYDVEILSAHTGSVLASLHDAVTVVDLAADPSGLLYGPPEEPPASPSARWLSKRGYDYYKAQSDVTFDVQEGKKGLNAVNVKLARTIGGAASAGGIAGGVVAGIVVAARDCGGHAPTVSAFSGDVQQQVVDLAVEGRGLDFIWARTYHSRLGRTGSATNGWTFSYDIHLQPLGGDIVIHDGTGRPDRYMLQTNGVYTCPELFCEGTLSKAGFRLTFADTGHWDFNPLDSSVIAGKIARIVDRNGNTVSLNYNTSGRLVEIVDDLGRMTTVAYNTAGQLASVTDFSGRVVRYAYDGHGDLVACVSPPVSGTPNGNDFPDGKTTTYTYSTGTSTESEKHLLLSVVDALGQTTASCGYDLNPASSSYLHCTSLQRGTGLPERITVLPLTATPANRFAVARCIVNDSEGNVTEGFYDARNRLVKAQAFTGRATPGLAVTDTVNRPTGQVRSTDPAYYETQWAWNNDSLCTLEVAPGGQQVLCVYQSDVDPTTLARKRADCRVVREVASSPVDLDGDGVADVTDRAWHFDYDPRFGSSKSASEWYRWRKCVLDGKVDRRSISVIFHNDAGEEAAYHAVKTKGTGANSGIVDDSPAALARGIITAKPGSTHAGSSAAVTFGREKLKATTKTQGDFNLSNRVNFEDMWPNNGDFDFNDQSVANNFAVSATDPRGNVTTGTYDAKGNRVKVRFYWDRLSSAERDFAYGAYGQATAITNAPDANGYRRVDTFSYYASGPQAGYLQSIAIDESGVHLTSAFEYDARGNLTRTVDPRTNDWLYTYNALDQCVRAQTPTNLTTRCATDFTYDANDNLVACSTQLRDAADTLVATPVDRASYDPLHRLTQIALAVDARHALTNRFAYDGNGECVQALGPEAVSGTDPHQTVAYQYDERGLLFREVAASGSPLQSTTQCDYDANGNPTRVSEGLEGTPRVTALEYDGFSGFGSTSSQSQERHARFEEAVRTENVSSRLRSGVSRLSKVTDPMGNVTTFNYDANDNLKVVRQFGELNDVPGTSGNIRLAESRFEYDGLDRRIRTHDLFFNPATQSPLGSGDAVSSCVLAPNGECVSVTNSLGRTTTYGYDTAGRSTSALSAGAIAGIVVARDACGNVTGSTETELSALGGPPQVFSTTYAYDSLNRCVGTGDNVGNTSTCAYDSLDRGVRVTDPNGNDTTYAYDLLGNCLASADYAGASSGTKPVVVRTRHTAYDTSSRRLASTDPNGNTTGYAYDTLGNCTNVVYADGTRIQKTWLPANFRMIETDPNGTTVTNIYDLCDRLIHRDIAARGGAVATTTFETFAYDGSSRLVLANNDVSSLSFSYDSLGDCTGGSQDGLAQSAAYDSEGNPLSLTYPSGRVVAYAYDVLDQVTNVSTSANGVSHPQLARFAYAGPGRLAGIARDNGLITRFDWNGLANPANSAGDYGWQEVSRVRDGSVASPALVCDVTNTYSRAQSKLTRADAGRSSLTLTYDALEQLVESKVHLTGSPALDAVYEFDAVGNRSHVITNGVLMTPDYAMNNNGEAPFDLFMNRYTTTPFGAQSYDANGNLIVRASAASPTFYYYDYADRLVEVDAVGTLGTVGPVATFTYDALGNRISKTTYPASPAAPVTMQYVNDVVGYKDGEDGVSHTRPGNHKPGRMRILEERSGGQVTHLWCWGPSCRAGGDLNRDGMPDVVVAFTATGAPHYYHCDDLGNVLALTDAGGNVLERYAYDDYGAVTFLTSDGTPTGAAASAVGNPYCWGGLRLDSETGLQNDGGGGYYDPNTGRPVGETLKAKITIRVERHEIAMLSGGTSSGNNPWTGGNNPLVNRIIPYSPFNKVKDHSYVGHVTLLK